ncbi:MAG: hypothetical protein US70_C0014G0015 [Parcubacteria group bacterium GW2011_GWD2_38_11]|nr:MAG: hypothetical protein US70_C0014G0015 [Parcubacteria group bacterium GW2011_GWD2_38_11]
MTFSVKKIFLLGLFFVALFSAPAFFLFRKISFQWDVRKTIEKGLVFLQTNQLPSGEMKVLYCEEKEMNNCKFESSSVPTVFVLDAISFSKNKQAKEIFQKGHKFVLGQQNEDGLWSYWSKESSLFASPDFDDTAVASLYLEKNNILFRENKNKFEKNPDGLYYTWTSETDDLMKKVEIDPGVNANILAYLKNNDEKVCSFVNSAVKRDNKKLFYYPNKQAFYYIISKAYSSGALCLLESKDDIIKKTISLQKTDGSFGNNLETALSLSTLLNYSFEKRDIIEKGIGSLMKTQNKDGSWNAQAMYVSGIIKPVMYFGSNELSTAISVEAIEKYLRML